MLLPPNYMSTIPLGVLRILNERMYQSTWLLIVFRTLNLMAISAVAFCIVATPFQQERNQRYAEYIESIACGVHTQAKYLFFIINKSKIEQLLIELTKIPWDPKDFTKKFLASDTHFQNLIRKVNTCFMVYSVVMVCTFMLRPGFHKSVFLLETWESNFLPINVLILALQYYLLLLIPPVIIAYDCLYLSLCAGIVVQVRRLKYKMAKIVTAGFDCKRDLCSLVEYHEHLLRTFRRLQDIYSYTFLFHYFITIGSNCAELYIFLRSSKIEIERLVNGIAVISEFAFYTFPAQALTNEFEGIPTSLYMSNWYKGSVEFQKLVVLTLMRGQMKEYLTGGGLIQMNVSTFVSVIRLSFSIYTLLRNTVYK